jgi:hypothetical protein
MFPLGCVADTFDTTRCDERPFLGMVLHDASLGVFALIITLASICSSSYSLISLPPVVLLTISLLLPCSCSRAPDETSSAGGDKLHPDDISSGDKHRLPYNATTACSIILTARNISFILFCEIHELLRLRYL